MKLFKDLLTDPDITTIEVWEDRDPETKRAYRFNVCLILLDIKADSVVGHGPTLEKAVKHAAEILKRDEEDDV